MTAAPEAGRPGQIDLLPMVPTVLWRQLPALAVGSLMVGLAVVVVILCGPGVTPAAIGAAALTVGPCWAALIGLADLLLRGQDGGIRLFFGLLGRLAGPAVLIFAVPALCGILALLALELVHQRAGLWFYGPLVVSTGMTIATGLGSIVAVPLRIWHPELRGRRLWYASLAVVAARPLIPLGVLAGAVLGGLALTSWTASLLPLIAGPLALVTAAGVWTAGRAIDLDTPSAASPLANRSSDH